MQHNEEGIDSFRTVVGVPGIIQALSTTDERLQRKVLVLATLFLQQSAADRAAAVQGGIVAALTSREILCSDSADVRAADRQLLHELTPAILACHTPPTTGETSAENATRAGAGTVDAEVSSQSSQTARGLVLEALKLRIDAVSKNQHSGAEDDGHDELAGLLKLRRQILEGKTGVEVSNEARNGGLSATSTSNQRAAPTALLLGGPASAN